MTAQFSGKTVTCVELGRGGQGADDENLISDSVMASKGGKKKKKKKIVKERERELGNR